MGMNAYEEIVIQLPKPPSLNKFYSGRHYAVRVKYKKEYWESIAEAIKNHDKFWVDSMEIHVRYNCRFDVDNAICCCKFLADYLRNHGYIHDDSPKFFTKQSTQYDPGVEKDKFVATIKGYGYKIIE